MPQTSVADSQIIKAAPTPYFENEIVNIAADPIYQNMDSNQLNKVIEETKSRMNKASKNMDFIEAARLRDEMFALQAKVENKEAK